MTDGTVFGRAVDEFYKKLHAMTGSLAAVCDVDNPSPTLFPITANMMCEAAEEAIKKFRAENPHPLRKLKQ
jgi:hypothetical protein